MGKAEIYVDEFFISFSSYKFNIHSQLPHPRQEAMGKKFTAKRKYVSFHGTFVYFILGIGKNHQNGYGWVL